MRNLGYIATLLYLPLVVIYTQFYSDNFEVFWNKYYFILDKAFIAMLLLSLISKEVIKPRKVIYYAGIGFAALFSLYLFVDIKEEYNFDKIAVTIYCSIAILTYLIALIKVKYDRTNQR
jgi:peptidoglycan/LPS O-acetylase OafA/YrhL